MKNVLISPHAHAYKHEKDEAKLLVLTTSPDGLKKGYLTADNGGGGGILIEAR